ncbi:MAG: hypothetical protein AAFZ80_06320 [Cyanobacteria bacterium P01_A01_bin.105]
MSEQNSDQNIEQSPVASADQAAEVAEVITEFEKYRERLLNDTMEAAKKAKMSKKDTMAKLEPELDKIDAALESLRSQYAQLTASE